MQFNAYLVKQNTSTTINISLVGILLFLLSIFAWTIPAAEDAALIATVSAFVLVIVGAVAGKGRGLYEVDKAIFSIDETTLQLGEVAYPIASISQLSFYYHSFYSQSIFGYYTEEVGRIEYGISNQVSFVHKNKTVTTRFYLAHIQHADNFFASIKSLQAKGAPVSLTKRYER